MECRHKNLGTSPPREARSLLGRTIFRSAPFSAICSSHTCHECQQDDNGDKYTVELNPLGSVLEQNNTAGCRGRPGYRYSTIYISPGDKMYGFLWPYQIPRSSSHRSCKFQTLASQAVDNEYRYTHCVRNSRYQCRTDLVIVRWEVTIHLWLGELSRHGLLSGWMCLNWAV